MKEHCILFAMSICSFLIFSNITILPIVILSIRDNTDLTTSNVVGLIKLYPLGWIFFLLAIEKIQYRFGVQNVFYIGLAFYALASFVIPFFQSVIPLYSFRLLQGVGAAFLLPTSITLLKTTLSLNKRAAKIYTSVGTIAVLIGPFLGTVIVSTFSWKALFFLNIPLIALILLLWLPFRISIEKQNLIFDWKGFLLFGCTLITFVSTLSHYFVFFSVSLFCMFFYLFIHVNRSFFDIDLFKNRIYSSSMVGIMLGQCLFMTNLLWVITLQTKTNIPIITLGFILFFSEIPKALVRIFGDVWIKRFPKESIYLGYTFYFLSFTLRAIISQIVSVPWIICTFLIASPGLPLIIEGNQIVASSVILSRKESKMNGLKNTLRHLGGLIGVTIIGALFTKIPNYSIYLVSAGISLIGLFFALFFLKAEKGIKL